MKFDCIIMNPPYQRNLHLKILAEAIKHLKDEKSVCVNLSPVRWLQDPLAKYKKNCDLKRFEESVAKHIENLDVFFAKEMSNIFQIQINTDLGLYKCSQEKHSFEPDNVPNASGKNIFLIRKIYEKITSKNLRSVEDQLIEFRHNTSYNYVTVSTIGGGPQRGIEHETHSILRSKNYGPFVDEKYNGKTIHEIKTANKFSVCGDVNNWPVVCFSTGNEAINFYGSEKTKFMMFLAWAFSSDQHVPNWAMPFLGDVINPRTGLKGYTGEWTDNDLALYFGITPEEQEEIERTMARYETK